jgi:putative transposase
MPNGSHIEPFVLAPKCRGRQRIHSPRQILNAVFFYILRSGCPWRLLPREYPPWKSVYDYFREWRIKGTFEKLNAVLREHLRTCLGRNPHPSAGIADSQSAKSTGVGGEQRGYNAGKKVLTPGSVTYWWTQRDWSSKPRYTARRSLSKMA